MKIDIIRQKIGQGKERIVLTYNPPLASTVDGHMVDRENLDFELFEKPKNDREVKFNRMLLDRADRISFAIYSKDGEDESCRSRYDDYRMVYNCIANLAPRKAVEYTDRVADLGKLTLIGTKWKYYCRERDKGNISREYMEGALRKILAEECGIIIIKKA